MKLKNIFLILLTGFALQTIPMQHPDPDPKGKGPEGRVPAQLKQAQRRSDIQTEQGDKRENHSFIDWYLPLELQHYLAQLITSDCTHNPAKLLAQINALSPTLRKYAKDLLHARLKGSLWKSQPFFRQIILNPFFEHSKILTVSPDNKHIACITKNSDSVYICQTHPDAPITLLQTYGKKIITIKFSPQGNLIAAGTNEGLIYIYSKQNNWKRIATLQKARDDYKANALVRALDFSPDGQFLVAGLSLKRGQLGSPSQLYRWACNKNTWKYENKIIIPHRRISNLCFSPEGSFIIATISSLPDQALIVDSALSKINTSINYSQNGGHASISPDGKLITLATKNNSFIIDPTNNFAVKHTVLGTSFGFINNTHIIVIKFDTSTMHDVEKLHIIDGKTGRIEKRFTLPQTSMCTSFDLSPRGKLFAFLKQNKICFVDDSFPSLLVSNTIESYKRHGLIDKLIKQLQSCGTVCATFDTECATFQRHLTNTIRQLKNPTYFVNQVFLPVRNNKQALQGLFNGLENIDQSTANAIKEAVLTKAHQLLLTNIACVNEAEHAYKLLDSPLLVLFSEEQQNQIKQKIATKALSFGF